MGELIHECFECGAQIRVRSKYGKSVIYDDGKLYFFDRCEECQRILGSLRLDEDKLEVGNDDADIF